ncbi:SRSF protein kinase 1-like [Dorcoceras hygrometricum]|uniref:SRSF protein kinase 1-like n=1 Tax=Dorcoceras hygrometricum TaxID=472368 RepID=A0A2Z6ZZ41_9LAMI|nr:SRSF protein kinase 1-like [Dorcoceras hygrometricum]
MRGSIQPACVAQSCGAIVRPAHGYAPPLARPARASLRTERSIGVDHHGQLPSRIHSRQVAQPVRTSTASGRPPLVKRRHASPNNGATIALDKASVARPARTSCAFMRARGRRRRARRRPGAYRNFDFFDSEN